MLVPNSEIPELIQALMQEKRYPHPVASLQLIETHISWVILTGDYVYKIKKPVNLGFLDFSSLPLRHKYCEEELRLNRRLAPQYYLKVIAITGSAADPELAGSGEAIEYCLQMHQFPQQAQLDRLLQQGRLDRNILDAFASKIARFHQQVAIADAQSDYGGPEQVHKVVMDVFTSIDEANSEADIRASLKQVSQWCEQTFRDQQAMIQQRRQHGFVRECHGDMHLRNLAWVNNEAIIFDCIEFNESLRWNDVISEVAFLYMDLQDRQQMQLAQFFLNRYLEYSGDYAGLLVLRYYLVYRAMVRAMVAVISLSQHTLEAPEKQRKRQEVHSYIELAEMYMKQSMPVLIITHGLSGSGKSSLTEMLLADCQAFRIRSDVERKRLSGMRANDSGGQEPGKGIYRHDITLQTYARLAQLAELVLDAGYSVIVDATFLSADNRMMFSTIASNRRVPFIILDFSAPAAELRRRVEQRLHDASDADLRVLEDQLQHYQPLHADEQPYIIRVDTVGRNNMDDIVDSILAAQGQVQAGNKC